MVRRLPIAPLSLLWSLLLVRPGMATEATSNMMQSKKHPFPICRFNPFPVAPFRNTEPQLGQTRVSPTTFSPHFLQEKSIGIIPHSLPITTLSPHSHGTPSECISPTTPYSFFFADFLSSPSRKYSLVPAVPPCERIFPYHSPPSLPVIPRESGNPVIPSCYPVKNSSCSQASASPPTQPPPTPTKKIPKKVFQVRQNLARLPTKAPTTTCLHT